MEVDLPDDYLSPRSKVARLLEQIDEAPTPSPTRSRDAAFDDHIDDQSLKSTPTKILAGKSRRSVWQEMSEASEDGEDDDDDDVVLPTRMLGRAARRMLTYDTERHEPSPPNTKMPSGLEADDLYSVTPKKALSEPQPADSADRLSDTDAVRPLRRMEGLFVSPSKSQDRTATDSDDDLPDDPLATRPRPANLGASEREERLAAEEALRLRDSPRFRAKHRKVLSSDQLSIEDGDAVSAPPEDEMEKIFSDATRPSRRASRKALLEMERETQRLAREQALAHQMKVRKKFTTDSLFAKFGFRQQADLPDPRNKQAICSSSSPRRSTDGERAYEDNRSKDLLSTPPSSPPTPWDAQKAKVDRGALAKLVPVRQDSLASFASHEEHTDDTTAGNTKIRTQVDQCIREAASPTKQSSRKAKLLAAAQHKATDQLVAGDQDDLEILHPMPAHLKVFDRVRPAASERKVQSKALHALKHLAHLNNDSTARHSVIDPVVVNAQLIAQAKAHARRAQQQRLDELKAKGVVVMSAEEQEREAEKLENLLERARQEAEDLRKKERAAAKRSRDEADEGAVVASDDEDEDEDWDEASELADGSGDSDAGESSSALSGEDAESDDHAVDGSDIATGEAGEVLQHDTASIDTAANKSQATRRNRSTFVVLDDDEEEVVLGEGQQVAAMNAADGVVGKDTAVLAPMATDTSSMDNEAKDPFAAFGFDDTRPAFDLMSPTQAFRATMQTPSQYVRSQHVVTPSGPAAQESLTCSSVSTTAEVDTRQDQLVPASQAMDTSQPGVVQWDAQLPETPLHTIKETVSNLSETPCWEPSQDAGLPSPWTAARKGRLFGIGVEIDEDHETQSTVRMRVSESPVVTMPQRRGRLTKGVRRVVVDDVDEETQHALPPRERNAFSEMQKRRLESLDNNQRAEAEHEMRNMMDEQAEESEDEYAGLGGDDSNMIAPETAEDRAMIDDESHVHVNAAEERELAKFFAERRRQEEEEATSKLYKDLTTGALRRRQGIGWELDEDEDEMAARRRQMRQREEARKRKLLLQDENVKGLLEGKGDTKGREAFLRTIGDEDGEQDDILEDEPADSQDQMPDAVPQPGSTDPSPQPLRELSPNKRPNRDGHAQHRPASKIRRVYTEEVVFSRPTSMLQVRQSLSFLLDEEVDENNPATAAEESNDDDDGEDAMGARTDSDTGDSDVEAEEVYRRNDGGFAPNALSTETRAMPPPPLPTDRLPASQRRTPAKAAVIDRLSLRRGSNSSSGSSSSAGWSAWSTGSGSTSKAPSLLRRATSNLSATSNANERGVSYGGSGASNANERGVSIGNGSTTRGNRKSSLAYQARAEERRLLVERSEKQRLDDRRKIAALRRQQGEGLGSTSLRHGQWE